MAFRFVDFGRQLHPSGPRRFGFAHNLDFERIGMTAAWNSFGSFHNYIQGTTTAEYSEEFKALCPPWVFGSAEPPGDVPALLRVLGDHAEEHGWPEGGRVGADAAAEVERLRAERAEMLEVLRSMQGAYVVGDLGNCAECYMSLGTGHRTDCRLGNLLARIEN